MRKRRVIGGILSLGLAGTLSLVSAPASFAASSTWTDKLPNLSDGTYKCNATHRGTQYGIQGGPLYWQDCTRAVRGGYWQTVTIVSNRSHQWIAPGAVKIESIRNGASVASVTCWNDIPNYATLACWGPTRRNSSGSIQAKNNGGGYITYGSGVFNYWDMGVWYSPTRAIVR